MYNLAHLCFFENVKDEKIDEIDLLIKSSIQGFWPSIGLLALILVNKYHRNITEKDFIKYSNATNNLILEISKIIEKCELLNPKSYEKNANRYRTIDFLYSYDYKSVLTSEIKEIIPYKNQQVDISREFYDGFGIENLT